ncbi:MAG: hypothetical protein PQJ59_18870 [Spirochaetales bacterium]|nr:hypothetical protein [Spirochaetales bacterium]
MLAACCVEPPTDPNITLDFDYDNSLNPTSMGNIYVIWLENEAGDIQHLFVSKKLIKGGITDQELALPLWQLSRYKKDNKDMKKDVNAVTAATLSNQDFTITESIDEERLGTSFTLYMEIDQSFQKNDWFTDDWKDQPAVLYSVQIDLDSAQKEYSLKPIGWTPMYETTVAGVVREVGTLVNDMRFITHSKVDDTPTFGEEDKNNSAIRSVGSITVTIKE